MSLRVMRIVIQKVEIPGSWLMMLIKEDILYMNLYIYIYIMIVLLIVLIVFVFFQVLSMNLCCVICLGDKQ